MNYLDELNPSQREAVEAGEGPALVLAAVGSGKTRVITYRILHLLRTGRALPQEIIALTFTNRAAREMRERVDGLLGGGARGLWVGTFHSACARVLRSEAHLLSLPPHFSIYSRAESLSLVKELSTEMRLNPELYPPAALLSTISFAKARLISPEAFSKGAPSFGLKAKAASLYPFYEKALRGAGALDFDDLIKLTAELLSRRGECLLRYQKRWRHILVDEYQDTNEAQARLLELLAGKGRNIFAVGDDDQSIYRWRGAEAGNILNFEESFPGARVFRLEENYRSTARILKGASSVIAANPGRRPKHLFTRRGEGEGIVFHWAKDEKEEARFIAKRLLTVKEEGALGLGDTAVFYRTNAQARPLEEALREARLPYQILKGQAFFERKVIQDLLAYLRLAGNPADERAFTRALCVPPRGFGPKALERLAPYLRESPEDVLEGAGKALSVGGLPPKQARALESFLGLMEGLRNDAKSLPIRECLEKLLERTGHLSPEKNDGESILEFLTLARSFIPEGEVSEGGMLSAFLEHLALASEADSAEPGREAVSLMTLHAAKGLEFPVVFIAGVEDGLIPHRRRGGDALELAEERRLFYVGMTRAKELLFLSGAEERSTPGRARRGKPSPFIAQIPQELFAEPLSRDAVPPSLSPFPRGSRVRHPVFGLGVVKDFKGSGEELMLLVNFERGGQKKLLLKYARLEPV